MANSVQQKVRLDAGRGARYFLTVRVQNRLEAWFAGKILKAWLPILVLGLVAIVYVLILAISGLVRLAMQSH